MTAPPAALSLEALWREAAHATVARGAIVDPSLDALRRLSTPAIAWTNIIPWPIDHTHDRIARMFDTHHLAIAVRDRDWLEQLHAAWDAAPWDFRPHPLRAQGEIALALAPDSPRRPGWAPDELQELLEEGQLSPAISSERAWLALATGDRAGARDALADYDDELARRAQTWSAADAVALRRIAGVPGEVLRAESRALHALVDPGA